jgi:hypothetical protein
MLLHMVVDAHRLFLTATLASGGRERHAIDEFCVGVCRFAHRVKESRLRRRATEVNLHVPVDTSFQHITLHPTIPAIATSTTAASCRRSCPLRLHLRVARLSAAASSAYSLACDTPGAFNLLPSAVISRHSCCNAIRRRRRVAAPVAAVVCLCRHCRRHWQLPRRWLLLLPVGAA